MHQWKSCYSRSSRLETYVTGLVCRQHCSCLLERSLSSVSMSTSNPFSHPAITLPGQKMVHPSSQLILLYNNIRQAFFVAFFTILIKIVSKQKKGEKKKNLSATGICFHGFPMLFLAFFTFNVITHAD